MFSLSRKWTQLRSSINAISGASATNTRSNNNIGNSARYHCTITPSDKQLIVKAEKRHTLGKRFQRSLSTLGNHSEPKAARITASKDERNAFMAVFPDVVRELSEAAKRYTTPETENWFTKALQYNLPHGKKNRGLLTVLTYKNLVKPDALGAENLKLAQYLGWCVEMVQCFFLINDDMMDNSTTRRGQLCWHKLEEVGFIAINDALMIESGVYELLRNNFRHLDCYVDLLELFHEITFITTCGQSMDLLNANKSVNTFTMDKYNLVVSNKTSHYTFYFPVALALHLAGVKDPDIFRQSKTILLEMGHLFQVQDDFLDCFSNPEISGKIGTDIQDNKCSWLAVTCMQRASPEQRAIMEECYGKNDSAKIARVKQLYKELDIARSFAIYEEEKYNMIKAHIQQATCGIPQEAFLQLLNKIYRRDS
ncbi:farnesyl pyrophosphate synthase-like [Anastrepha obliqua]|uniref:farnesyl pyrophosphate synthase-like n=1 Tax=Anastrepha obliqua TaxID=95512 RepID=UPI00240A407E|nr:farnesyl pyrophosphate synthase-like [Anastrepha obliqua]